MKYFHFLLLALVIDSCAFQSESVDLIIHNAKIYTVDDAFSICEAIAIKDGIIVSVGAEREIMNKYSSAITIDAQKQTIYPGFIDAHCHLLAFGYTLQDANLEGTKSFEEIIERAKAHDIKSNSSWIIGRGWDQNDWPDTALPTREVLDSLFPNKPVYLTRIDGHAALVNGAALELASISINTKVEGGEIDVKDGKCTGLLIDNAKDLVSKWIPERSFCDKEKALLDAQRICFSEGLTTVDEAGLDRSDIVFIDSLQRVNKIRLRIYAMASDNEINYEYYLKNGIDTSSSRLTVRSFKFYADGALGSRGACLLNPYTDILEKFNQRDYGFLLDSINHYRKYMSLLYQKGFQVNTHAIGDSANRVILGIYGDILGNREENAMSNTNDKRWRVEHAQVVDKSDIDLFRKYAIIPSVQPTHATSDAPWAWERLGRNRIRKAYAYKGLKDQLGMLALGTDFPVEKVSPMGTFYSAVYRKDALGVPSGGFQIENALSREEALRGMTIWAALSNFEEHHKGSLEVGKYADLIMLDKDIMECAEEQLMLTKVIWTICGGELVYER